MGVFLSRTVVSWTDRPNSDSDQTVRDETATAKAKAKKATATAAATAATRDEVDEMRPLTWTVCANAETRATRRRSARVEIERGGQRRCGGQNS